jgi:hypothetical protein
LQAARSELLALKLQPGYLNLTAGLFAATQLDAVEPVGNNSGPDTKQQLTGTLANNTMCTKGRSNTSLVQLKKSKQKKTKQNKTKQKFRTLKNLNIMQPTYILFIFYSY